MRAERQETVILEDGFSTSISKPCECRGIITTTSYQAILVDGIWRESYTMMSKSKARKIHSIRLKQWNS